MNLLQRVEITNFRNFDKHRKFDLSKNITLICGENGTGKSTVFDSISYLFVLMSYAFFDFPNFYNYLKQDTVDPPLFFEFNNSKDMIISGQFQIENESFLVSLHYKRVGTKVFLNNVDEVYDVFRILCQRLEETGTVPAVARYTKARWMDVNMEEGLRVKHERKSAFRYNFAPTIFVPASLSWLYELKGKDEETFNLFCEFVSNIMGITVTSGLASVEFYGETTVPMLVWGNDNRSVIPAMGSADSAVFFMALDFFWRMYILNQPYLSSERTLKNCPGVVLIDGVETSMHKRRTTYFLSQFSRFFPNVKIIGTTIHGDLTKHWLDKDQIQDIQQIHLATLAVVR